MSLKDLHEEIYKEKPDLPEQKPGVFRPEKEGRYQYNEESGWRPEKSQKQDGLSFGKFKKYFLWGGIGVAIIGIILFFLWGRLAFRSFDKSRLAVEITALKTIESGEKISISVSYINKNRVALKDVKLSLEYPGDSLPLGENFSEPTHSFVKTVDLGIIEAEEKGKLEFPVIVFGAAGETKEIKAKFVYMPENFASTFENEYIQNILIEKIPISLGWQMPEEIVSGQNFEAKLTITNSSANDFYNARINIEYPADFIFENSDPLPSKDKNAWDFKKLDARAEKTIIIKGKIFGNSKEIKPFNSKLGIIREVRGTKEFVLYDEFRKAVTITTSPLFISQTVKDAPDNIVDAGKTLNFAISYKNTTNVGIEKVEISVELEGEALDFAHLKIERGSFDSFQKMISWKAGEISELAVLSPNEEGAVKFSIPVKKALPIKTFSDKNFLIKSVARINSLNVPISLAGTSIKGENSLIFKVNGRIDLWQKGYYFESPISNYGPIPPKVGEKTTYNIIWQIANSSNDIEDVKVESYIPAYVSWEGQIEPNGANIFYDHETRKITWNIGKLPAQTGILYPLKQVAFQIGLVPSLNHMGKVLDLIGEANISGKDAFTGKQLQNFSPVIMTDLPDDPFVGLQKGKVTQ